MYALTKSGTQTRFHGTFSRTLTEQHPESSRPLERLIQKTALYCTYAKYRKHNGFSHTEEWLAKLSIVSSRRRARAKL